MIQAYNDWHVDEWCGAYPDRFIPCGILPLFDVDKAAAEVRRLADKGCHAVTFSENPEALQMPSIHSGEWDPLFAACCDVGTVLCCHVGSSSRPAPTSTDAPASVNDDHVVGDVDLHARRAAVGRLLGPLPRPAVLAHRGRHRLDPVLPVAGRARPGPPLRLDQARRSPTTADPGRSSRTTSSCCFINEDVGVRAARRLQRRQRVLGVGLPALRQPVAERARRWLPKMLADLPADVGRQDHPRERHAALPVRPVRAPRPKERCTVGALRAESPDVDTVTHVGRPADDRDLEAWRKLTMGRQAAAAQS